MSWIDFALIAFFIISIGMGIYLGSLWSGACLIGGFVGAYVADVYGFSVGGMIGSFPGATAIGTIFVFLVSCFTILIPGWLLSRFGSLIFLGFIDSAAGVFTGVLAGSCAIILGLLFITPHIPKFEEKPAWKKSVLVRPLQRFLQKHIDRPSFRRAFR